MSILQRMIDAGELPATLEFKGETKTPQQWCQRFGITEKQARNRISYYGWSALDACTKKYMTKAQSGRAGSRKSNWNSWPIVGFNKPRNVEE